MVAKIVVVDMFEELRLLMLAFKTLMFDTLAPKELMLLKYALVAKMVVVDMFEVLRLLMLAFKTLMFDTLAPKELMLLK